LGGVKLDGLVRHNPDFLGDGLVVIYPAFFVKLIIVGLLFFRLIIAVQLQQFSCSSLLDRLTIFANIIKVGIGDNKYKLYTRRWFTRLLPCFNTSITLAISLYILFAQALARFSLSSHYIFSFKTLYNVKKLSKR
jgi:hypothetical protein